ncbi:MAG TPA: MATE family efflux transporter, partial [Bradyrhizobium sp.]|nr:MATE family efflux transporter [Bradyrhizobium sp.]
MLADRTTSVNGGIFLVVRATRAVDAIAAVPSFINFLTVRISSCCATIQTPDLSSDLMLLRRRAPDSPWRGNHAMQSPLTIKASRPVAKIGLPIFQAFLLFVAPIMLSNFLQPLAGTISSIYLGQMIGIRAFAAASAFVPVQLFCAAFIMGLGTGATVLIGQAYSAGRKDRLQAVVGTALSIALLGGIATGVAGIFARPLLAALGTPADVLADATDYARVMLCGQIVLFFFMPVAAMMRAVGDTVTPVLALTASTAVGVIVGPVLIQGRAGLPAFGVTGAAWAIIISWAVALAWLVLHLRRRSHPLLPDAGLLPRLRIDRTVFRAILVIAASASVQIYAIIIGMAALLAIANEFGSEGTAAYG